MSKMSREKLLALAETVRNEHTPEGVPMTAAPKSALDKLLEEATARPWEVQQLDHADGELWLQIGCEGFGPIAGVTGDETRPPTFQAVAGMKYLATPESEIRANASLIALAVNEFRPMVDLLRRFIHSMEDCSDSPPPKEASGRFTRDVDGGRIAARECDYDDLCRLDGTITEAIKYGDEARALLQRIEEEAGR